MAGPSDGLPTNTATILYQRCVILSQTHLGRIKANPYWQHDQQQILRQSIARLILWGEDLCEGELERCLAHSSSLKHAVLEVLSSLGTALVNESLLASQQLLFDEEEQILHLRSILNEVYLFLTEVESDNASTIPETHSDEDEPSAHYIQAFVGDVERCVTLLFQLAPTIETMSETLLVDDDTESVRMLEDTDLREALSPVGAIASPDDTTKTSTAACDDCQRGASATLPVWSCHPCGVLLCEECWDGKVAHRPHTSSVKYHNMHEKTDPAIAQIIACTLEATNDAHKQEVLHAADRMAFWFGAEYNSQGIYDLLVSSRFPTIMADRSSQSPGTRYPALVSFLGTTGCGKSALVKLLIDLHAQGEDAPVPVVSSMDDWISPVSSQVHLYSDPCSIQETIPILYADTEGLDGGERAASAQASTRSNDQRLSSEAASDVIAELQSPTTLGQITCKRTIFWASIPERQSREYLVRNFYPRLLYEFSDVVVYVERNMRVIESMLRRLMSWAGSEVDASSCQPFLPHAIIVLNAAEPGDNPDHWDVDVSTEELMRHLESIFRSSITLQIAAESLRAQGRPVESAEGLLRCYYSNIRVVRVPALRRPKLIYDQLERLYNEIERAVKEMHEVKRQRRRLLDSDQLQVYYQLAFDHFCQNPKAPFDFSKASFPVRQSVFEAGIRSLAENTMKAASNAISGPDIFDSLQPLVASCIMLDAVRHGSFGDAEMIFSNYTHQLDGALEGFCNYTWPCEFMNSRGQCVNTKAGHTKGHQLKSGQIFGAGCYQAELSAETYLHTFRAQTFDHLQSMFGSLSERTVVDELHMATSIHREVVSSFYAKFRDTVSFRSSRICLSCLVGAPEHILSCAHILCSQCVRDFGIEKDQTLSTFMLQCPLHRHETEMDTIRLVTKPRTAGPRILVLDGGGIRSIVQLTILDLLERELDGDVGSFFDLIVGTNFGGLIALGLGVMQWSVAQCIQQFTELFPRILRSRKTTFALNITRPLASRSRYPTKTLQAALQSMFGEGALFGGERYSPRVRTTSPKVAVTTTSLDGIAYIMANYSRSADRRGSKYRLYCGDDADEEIKIWQAAHATCAAPTFFKPFIHVPSGKVFMDGALIYNNPVEVADREYRLIWPEVEMRSPDLLLSLGTGVNINARRATQQRSSKTGLLGQFATLVNVVTHAISSTLISERTWKDYLDKQIPASDQGERYKRLNLELGYDPPELDDSHSMSKLIAMTREDFATRSDEIQQIAAQLIASSFFLERTSHSLRQAEDRSLILTASIVCRFDQGSEELECLGTSLERKMLGKSDPSSPAWLDPAFVVRTQGSPKMIHRLTEDIVKRMVTDRTFSMDEITIQVPSTDSETSIGLRTSEANSEESEYPIGGSPRCVVKDLPGERRPRRSTFPPLSRTDSWASAATTLIDPEEALAIREFLGLSVDNESPNASPPLEPASAKIQPRGPSDSWSLQSDSTVDLGETAEDTEAPRRNVRTGAIGGFLEAIEGLKGEMAAPVIGKTTQDGQGSGITKLEPTMRLESSSLAKKASLADPNTSSYEDEADATITHTHV